jgi:protein transport protein SEC31
MFLILVFSAAGDRSHIPDHLRPAYEIISENLNRIKQTMPVRPRLTD